MPTELGADEEHENDDQNCNTGRGVNDMVFDHFADTEHKPGKSRQLGTVQHAFEHRLEGGYHFDHQNDKNRGGHDEDRDRIEHGGDYFAFDLLRLFHELGETVQHDFKHTAEFARFHHVDKQPIEHLGMLRQGFRKCAAAFD